MAHVEILERLGELLQAERAGARVCTLSLADAPTPQHQDLLQDIHQDEVKSCRALIGSIVSLGGQPDKTVGNFVVKCMAIPDFVERLRFLNRGQAWVARKISDLLPRVENPGVRAQLTEMLDDHRRNIEELDSFLALHHPLTAADGSIR